MKENITIIDTITFNHGMRIDKDEAWLKLTQRQFGGTPGRGFGELVQNGYDGYDASVDGSDRRLDIESTDSSIHITDYGVGMDREKLPLLVTLGGTDKANDRTKLGKFGIGFSSMFNPDLGTEKIVVLTMCEGHAVELVFNVIEPGKIPEIKTRLLPETLPFSTRITTEFDNSQSSDICLDYARKFLRTLPCNARINGHPYKSIWEEARQAGHKVFISGQCMGFIQPQGWYGSDVRLLRRFEKIMEISIGSLMTGGHSMKFDLRDWSRKETPYVKNISMTINCNNLNVPISRDGFYLDSAYHQMVKIINEQMMFELENQLKHSSDRQLVLANHFILRNKIARYLDLKIKGKEAVDIHPAVKALAKAKIYPINGRSKLFSLLDLMKMKTENLPLFYSPGQSNLRWLGGAFKHDFIVLPPWLSNRDMPATAPDFYNVIFKRVFPDVVNLDDVEYDHDKMASLVKQGIIEKESLSPNVQLTRIRKLNKKELSCIEKIDRVLSHDSVKKAIAKNLNLQVSRINAAFFELENSGGVIATGFLDKHGNPLEQDYYSNMVDPDGSDSDDHARPILLGIQKDNVFIDSLINTDDEDMPYYMLMYLIHELAMCQKLLVPYSPYFHVVKSRLAKDMRQAMVEQLLSKQETGKKMETTE